MLTKFAPWFNYHATGCQTAEKTRASAIQSFADSLQNYQATGGSSTLLFCRLAATRIQIVIGWPPVAGKILAK